MMSLMSKKMRSQKGVTFLGWLIILGLIAFFVLLTLRIGPLYLQNMKMKNILKSLKDEPLITKKSKAQIKRLLRKRFDINYIDQFNVNDVVQITKEGGKLEVNISYEVRQPMAGNLDACVSFSEGIVLIAN